MGRKEKLLQKLKQQKEKLELRRFRFKLWEEELTNKDEKGLATAEDIKKENMFWRKGRRLSDRIDFVSDKIYELEKDGFFVGAFKKLGGLI